MVKRSACNTEDLGSIPGPGRSPGEGNGNPLQYSCLRNPMDRGAWPATVHGVEKSQPQMSDQYTHNMITGKKVLNVVPCGSVVKNPPVNAGDTGLIPGPGRSLPPQGS